MRSGYFCFVRGDVRRLRAWRQDVDFDILTSFCVKRSDINFIDWSPSEYFLLEYIVILARNWLKKKKKKKKLSKDEHTGKRIYNGSSVRIENSVTRDNYSASLAKPRDAEQLHSWRNFQSAPHNFKDSYIKNSDLWSWRRCDNDIGTGKFAILKMAAVRPFVDSSETF